MLGYSPRSHSEGIFFAKTDIFGNRRNFVGQNLIFSGIVEISLVKIQYFRVSWKSRWSNLNIFGNRENLVGHF